MRPWETLNDTRADTIDVQEDTRYLERLREWNACIRHDGELMREAIERFAETGVCNRPVNRLERLLDLCTAKPPFEDATVAIAVRNLYTEIRDHWCSS